jgi:ATP-binding cassette subfamily B protein
LAVVGLSAAIEIWRKKVEFKQNNELVPEQRKADYIARVYSLPDYSKEIRLSHAGELLVDGYTGAIERQKSIRKRFGFITYHISNLINMLNLLIFEAGISILLIYKLFSGDILLGDFAAGNNAVWQLHWQINTLVGFLVKFPEHSLYIEKFRAFMEYETKVKSGKRKADEIKSIEFKNVSFSYPSSETESLKNIDLTINKGEKIAIVGYNGAGKTTLIKLLLRLYDPTEGEVKLNGENLCESETESYREKTGAVFQDYQIFAASIAENVAADIYNHENKEKVLKALHLGTFDGKLESLEKGIDTRLTREFSDEGVNLSGGEAQKIAIARVFYRDCELIVMDEPSSALDPMAEYELNQTIMNYAQDKTVIFISHRLSTTRMADRIYMLADGSIIEQGTHEELMSACGKYSEMFNLQAEKYRKEQIINEIESLSTRYSQEQS